METATEIAIGIDLGDLGTTNSAVAFCLENGKATVIPSDQTGHKITPSYVAYQDGNELVGTLAKTTASQNPRNCVFQIKRILGRDWDDKEVERNRKAWPFKVIKGSDNKPMISVKEMEDDPVIRSLTPVEITAIILKTLKDYASLYLGKPITKAVITIPAKFNAAQRRATTEAGRLAGLDVIGMINEPTAAAMGYVGAEPTGKKFLVFDFGGGTLDVSILQCGTSHFTVLATEGNMLLGGSDFDKRLLDHFVARFQEKHGIDLRSSEYESGLSDLLQQCEAVKMQLSGAMEARAVVASIADDINFQDRTTRATFEELCDDLFRKVLDPVKDAIRVAGLQKEDLDFVLLVGGSSRMPKVTEVLGNYFGKERLKHDVSWDETIAMGAAIYAQCILQSLAGKPSRYRVSDITPFNLGVCVTGGSMVTIIEKGSQLPVSASKVFKPAFEGATVAAVKVYQGESQFASENVFLTELLLRNISLGSGDAARILVNFSYNESGLLKITAGEGGSSDQQSAVVPLFG